jgi:peptidyl-prolyl cis-trans isomerase B (cyclophilin B)
MKVQLKTTLGDIVLELDAVRAPNTAANFVDYVREGFYDGTLFHRVIDGFMVQGGGFLPGMQRKPTRAPIVNEADNGLRNVLGSIAMARTPDPHSASSQFFINVADNAFLDFKAKNDNGWGYCVFGRVVEGMDVVGRIKAVSTTTRAGNGDVPVEDVVIEQATMLED